MTDRVQYVTTDDAVLLSTESSIVPRKHEHILLNGDEWQVCHIAHTIKNDDHIATVVVWQPNDGWTDDDIEQTAQDIAQTLRAQRKRERERSLNTDSDRSQSGSGGQHD